MDMTPLSLSQSIRSVVSIDTNPPSDINLRELAAVPQPHSSIELVCVVVMHLLAGVDTRIQTVNGKVQDASWQAAQSILVEPEALLQSMRTCKDAISKGGAASKENAEIAFKILSERRDDLDVNAIRKKSQAAASLFEW